MRNVLMIASAAALAVSMPALAEKGGKGGGGNGGGKDHAAQAQGGGGGNKQARGGGGGGKPDKAQRQAFQGGGGKPDKAQRQAFQGGGGKPDKAERQASRGGVKPDKAERQAFKPAKQERKAQRQVDREFVRAEDLRRGGDTTFNDVRDGDRRFAGFGSANCPPGLAKKGCMPPGQAKKAFNLGQQVQPSWFSGYNVPSQYSAFYPDSADAYYRYSDEGYIYRVNSQNNLVSGLIPLLGGGFAVGQPMPAGYDVYNVPYQYRDDFYDTDDSYYRYGDDAIYEVDPQSGMIESIVALLGGGDLGIGQALPSGYDAYNVPMDYRDDYQDTDESMYRYADGNIYQVDTKTQIIQAIVEMLV